MDPNAIISLASEVAGVISKVLDKLPDHSQKVMKSFYEFLDEYETEVKKANADFDKILLMRQRKKLLMEKAQEWDKALEEYCENSFLGCDGPNVDCFTISGTSYCIWGDDYITSSGW